MSESKRYDAAELQQHSIPDTQVLALVLALRQRSDREPLGVDISDYSDEFCAGFLAGQSNALDSVVEKADRA